MIGPCQVLSAQSCHDDTMRLKRENKQRSFVPLFGDPFQREGVIYTGFGYRDIMDRPLER